MLPSRTRRAVAVVVVEKLTEIYHLLRAGQSRGGKRNPVVTKDWFGRRRRKGGHRAGRKVGGAWGGRSVLGSGGDGGGVKAQTFVSSEAPSWFPSLPLPLSSSPCSLSHSIPTPTRLKWHLLPTFSL